MGEDSRRCGARARTTGKPCRRFKLAGRARCRLHGGKSTGPTSPEGLAASTEARLDHGAYAQLKPYARALASISPEMFLAATATTTLDDEIRFARAKLATLAQRAEKTGQDLTGPISEVLTNLRLLVAQKHEINPASDIGGKFELKIKLVGGAMRDAEGRRFYWNEKGERVYSDDPIEHGMAGVPDDGSEFCEEMSSVTPTPRTKV